MTAAVVSFPVPLMGTVERLGNGERQAFHLAQELGLVFELSGNPMRAVAAGVNDRRVSIVVDLAGC